MFGRLDEPNFLGTYESINFDTNNTQTGFLIGECISVSDINNNIVYNLSVLGEVGEYIDINFSGSYEDFQDNPRTITGVVHVLRDN